MYWITKYTTLFVCMVMLVCGQSHATLIAYEGFEYSSGSLNNGGSGWDGAWDSGNWTASENGLSYTDSQGTSLVTSGGSAITASDSNNQIHFRELSSASQELMDNSSVFWMSFLIESRSENPQGTYGISLYEGSSEQILLGRHFEQGDPEGSTLASTGWNSGVSTVQDEGESETWRFVAQFDMPNEQANFWINPDIGGAAPANALASGSQTISAWNTTEIRLGQFGNSDGSNFSLDEIGFGTDYASVTPIPEPGTLVLVGLALGSLLFFRRKQ